jgi:predicted dehydrogenase
VVKDGRAVVAAIDDPRADRRETALALAPGALACESLGQLLELPLDGVVIATPSAVHAEQAIAALDRGLAVFCQKPLARSSAEARKVIDAARRAGRLLAVDMSYRHTAAVRAMADVVRRGGIGRVFAAQLVFHNAYGPDAAWFYERRTAGGGCVMDLGIHLVDLLLSTLDFPAVTRVDSQLFAAGRPLAGDDEAVEDYAAVQLALASGVAVQLACSWRVSAGQPAVIGATLFGSEGGVSLKNQDGSFYDFVAERFVGTRSEVLATPPDEWGGRAIVDFVEHLAAGSRFDAEAEQLVQVAEVLDQVYARAGGA